MLGVINRLLLTAVCAPSVAGRIIVLRPLSFDHRNSLGTPNHRIIREPRLDLCCIQLFRFDVPGG